jgi:hypothetical protein
VPDVAEDVGVVVELDLVEQLDLRHYASELTPAARLVGSALTLK